MVAREKRRLGFIEFDVGSARPNPGWCKKVRLNPEILSWGDEFQLNLELITIRIVVLRTTY